MEIVTGGRAVRTDLTSPRLVSKLSKNNNRSSAVAHHRVRDLDSLLSEQALEASRDPQL